MFPDFPQNLENLTDEELSAQIVEFQTAIKHVAQNSRDPEVVGDLTQPQVLEATAKAVEQLETLKDALKELTETDAEYDTKIAELSARAGVELAATDEAADGDDSDEGDAEGDAADGDSADEGAEAEASAEQPEAVAASAAPATKARRSLPAARRRNRPSAQDLDDGTGLRSAVTVQELGIERGEKIGRRNIGDLYTIFAKRNKLSPGDRAVIASASIPFPEDRILGPDGERNWDKIAAVTGPQALVASGGLCAPLTPIYDLPGVETADRPVRNSLPSFQASRGGVQVGATPIMGDYAEAVGVVTAADDEAGGTFAVKNCMRIECPEFSSVEVDSIYHCIEAGNLTARAYPELMARIDELVRAEQARLADGRLLDFIKAGSTAVTDPNTTATAGAMWKLLGYIHAAASAMRNRHRMSDDAQLRVILPTWVIDLLVVDLARNNGDSDRFKTRAEVEGILGRAGISVTFTKDGPSTGTGQVFGAQTAGSLLPFPADVQFPLFPEGTWLHLDSGTLELGIVRDSTLNSTNDFQIFGETWENVAYVGVESQWHTATIAPNGTNSAPKDYSASTVF